MPCGAVSGQLWCRAPAATPSAGLSCFAWPSGPVFDRSGRRTVPEGPQSWHGTDGRTDCPIARNLCFARCRDDAPPARNPRATCLFPGFSARAGGLSSASAARPTAPAIGVLICDTRIGDAMVGTPPGGPRGIARRIRRIGGAWHRHPCRAPPRSIETTGPWPRRTGGPRPAEKRIGRRRMVDCQPRRPRFPGPATHLRRIPAFRRRGAEFPFP